MPKFENNSVSESRQAALAYPRAAALNLDYELRNAVGSAIHQSALSVEQIAERMSGLLGQEVTASMLRDFAGRTKTHRFPAAWVPAFMLASGSEDLLALQLEALGMRMPREGDAALLDFARAVLVKEKADQELSRARALVEELEP